MAKGEIVTAKTVGTPSQMQTSVKTGGLLLAIAIAFPPALTAGDEKGVGDHWRVAIEQAVELEPLEVDVSSEEADAAWSRANAWVARNHWTKVQHSDDYSIQTFTDSSGNSLLVSREDMGSVGSVISVSGIEGWQSACLARFIRTADSECRNLKHQEKWNNNGEYRACLLECETEKKGCVPKVSLELSLAQFEFHLLRT